MVCNWCNEMESGIRNLRQIGGLEPFRVTLSW
jgi:hypothetical protein